MIKKGLGFNAITALIMLTTSNCVIAEEYQLPATINNPVVMPVGADGFQNGAAKAIIPGQAGSEQSGAQTNLSEAGNAQGQNLQLISLPCNFPQPAMLRLR